MRAPPPVFGLVLVGGRSSRMGRPKDAIRYGRQPQYLECFDLLDRFCEETWLSCGTEQAGERRFRDLPVIKDLYPDQGPAGGILSAHERRPGVAWLVVACDLPFIRERDVSRLVRLRDASRGATAYRASGRDAPEPLLAIYEPGILRKLAKAFGKGERSPSFFLRKFRIKLIRPVRPLVLRGANDQAEHRQALRLLEQERIREKGRGAGKRRGRSKGQG